MKEKICSVCQCSFKKRTKYCSAKCYFSIPVSDETKAKHSLQRKGKPKSQHMRDALSKTVTGKPRPHLSGDKNPNWQGKGISSPETYDKFRKAVAKRGLAWNDEHKKAHSQKMLGDSNSMRGKNHSPEAIVKITAAKIQQYKDGTVKVSRYKISKAEKEITLYLKNIGHEVQIQFHIPGVPFLYDIYLPKLNLIIEYQGDYWHANPNKYPSGTQIKIFGKEPAVVDTIWDRDKKKKDLAEQHGYIVKYIWETNYKLQEMQAVEQCLLS